MKPKMNDKKLLAWIAGVTLATSSSIAMAYATFTSGSGITYLFDRDDGEFEDVEGSLGSDRINNYGQLRIDGTIFNGTGETFPTDNSGDMGVDTISGLIVRREVYVSPTENFLRQLSILKNPTTADIPVTVTLDHDISTAGYGLPAAPAAGTPMQTVIATDNLNSFASIWGSSGAAEAVDVMNSGATNFDPQWDNVVVPAGGTVIFMEYHMVMNRTGAVAAFSNLGTDMLTGISATDLGNIVNWNMTDADANGELDVMQTDTDGDGIVDEVETALGVTDLSTDADTDGLTELAEYNAGSNPAVADSDGDTLSDSDEINTYGSNPNSTDSDLDGVNDNDEVAAGTDPADSRDNGFIVVSKLGQNTHSPDVAVDDYGRIHVVWMQDSLDDYNVMYKLMDATGTVLIGETRLSSSHLDDFNDQGHPSITVNSAGNPFIAWFSSDTEHGAIMGLNTLAHPLDGTSADPSAIALFGPRIVPDCKRSDLAVASDGNIHMACSDENNDRLAMAVISPAGAILNGPFEVGESGGDYAASRMSMALDGDDMAHIVWYNDQQDVYPGEIFYSMVDGMTGDVKIKMTNISFSDDDSDFYPRHPSISLNADGKAYVTWNKNIDQGSSDTDSADIMLTSFDPTKDDQSGGVGDLVAMGLSTIDLTPAQVDTHSFYSSSVLGSDGKLLVMWNDGGGEGVAPHYYLKFDTMTNLISTARTRIDTDDDNGNYNTYGNFMAASANDTNLVAYVTDENQAVTKLARLDASSFPATAPAGPVAPASGDDDDGFLGIGAFSSWLLGAMATLVALARTRRRL